LFFAAVVLFTGIAQGQTPGQCDLPTLNYVVKNGDSFWRIADQQYGTGMAFFFLAESNHRNPTSTIHPGDTLTIFCCVPRARLLDGQKFAATMQMQARAPRPAVRRVEVARAAPAPPTPVFGPLPAEPTVPSTQTSTNVSINVAPKLVINNSTAPAQAPPAPQAVVLPPPAAPIAPPALANVPCCLKTKLPKTKSGELVAFPGSAWDSALNTPLEKGNFINYAYVTQGVTIFKKGGFQIQPYVALNTTVATKSYSWDNRAEIEGGVKFIQSFRHGLVDVRVAYGYEARRDAGSKSAPVIALDDWFGWGQPSTSSGSKKFLSAFPGMTWATVGYNVSPYERGNVIGLAKVEQGFVATKFGKARLIPDAWIIAGADSKSEFWNNRVTIGGGIKVAVPIRKMAFDVTAGWERASQYRGIGPDLPPASGFVIKVNLWDGWRLHKGGS
jgi:hypothetical protein